MDAPMQVRRSALAGEAEATEAKLPGLELSVWA